MDNSREEKNKNVFIECLNQALALDLKEPAFTRKPEPKQLPRYYTNPKFRLIILLEGKHVYTILGERGFEEVKLTPGSVLFCQRGSVTGSIGYKAKEGTKMLTITFWPELVRFLVSSLKDDKSEREHRWYHSHYGIDHVGMYILRALDELANNPNPNVQACYLAKVLLQLCREHLLADSPNTVTKAFKTYQNIMVYLSENFGEDINRESVAKTLAISPQHISKLFATYNDHSFNAVLKMLRLEYSEELLKNTTFLISEIAEECGFTSVDYFIKSFKGFYGETPGNFRRKME